ncbi:low-density lipoprotein receptor-like [Thrips palmi]|uniref:Low-density lipoprotein receptor-like n=1 Tax=Thrips palmi TaxID=161013 RepID=A0A6P9AMK0_THRPL|nr:low-density lipoprotein receptor-like [Thrips palmi]
MSVRANMEFVKISSVLVLPALLLGASHAGAFDCKDGRGSTIYVCDGSRDCADGSDESPAFCDGFTNLGSLAPGERVTAVLDHTKRGERILILMCSPSFCSRLTVIGGAPSGALQYETSLRNSPMGRSRQATVGTYPPLHQSSPSGAKYLPEGQVAFTVRAR